MRLHLLAVDDQPSMRQLLSLIASEDQRFSTVVTAGTAAEALRQVAQAQPDVIVLNAQLGEDDGLQLLPRLRILAPEVAVAVYSSAPYADPPTSAAAGADAFVAKGTDPEELLDLLVDLAAHRSAVASLKPTQD